MSGRRKGRRKRKIILNLLKIKMPKGTIAQVTRSSIDYVEEVIQNARK